LRLAPYDDNNSKKKTENYCTIGWGHLIAGKENCATLAAENNPKYVVFKNGITREKADAIFLNDLAETLNIVRLCIHAPLYQHEYDAIVSLAFNAGGAFVKFKKLIAAANSGQYKSCCAEFEDITAGGKPGLILRRKREMDIFNHAIYNSKH
jgi:GH24 family phage-related lysozyme (muramidase)